MDCPISLVTESAAEHWQGSFADGKRAEAEELVSEADASRLCSGWLGHLVRDTGVDRATRVDARSDWGCSARLVGGG